ncbi:hypothetical protein HDZ31DRAFT_76286 [Schizophyllum fasciatum]
MSILSSGTMAAMLRRQPRTRTRKSPQLHIIEEESENEPRSSYSSSGGSRVASPVSGVKARRRNARISASDIKIASTILSDLDGDAAPLTPTRPAPSPPPCRDSDEFSIIFTEKEFSFPYAYGSDPSSPASSSASSALPGTPSTSDDEFATTEPLHIEKKSRQPASDAEDSDSDLEEGCAWYSRELASVVDMQPKLARRPTITGSRPRPESIYVASTSSTRVIPCHMPSPQLDPQYPRRTFVIPKRAPPPPPAPERTPPRESRVPEDLMVDDLLDEYFNSPASSPSQSDFSEESLLEDIPFLLEEEEEVSEDAPIQLPLCLPTSPFAVDFEFDEHRGPFTLEAHDEPEVQEDRSEDTHGDSESHILRSRWSSSTLDSAYSAGPTSPKARLMKMWNKHTSTPKSPKAPKTTKHAHSRSMSSYLASPRSPYFKFRPEEVAVVDYANGLPPTASSSRFPRAQLHMRSPSASTPPSQVIHSSAQAPRSPSSSTPPSNVIRSPSRQSCSSADSSDSAGLRRKPIPVEMFLRA